MSIPKAKLEYGDYQTPHQLAEASCGVLARLGFRPTAILEPTCGLGNFLKAAVRAFPSAREARGFDINHQYVCAARLQIGSESHTSSVLIEQSDFFETNWGSVASSLPDPLLVVGNPPWVTNSALSSLRSANLPAKSNFQRHSGLDAVTGKSNFDISEYMLIRLSEALQGKNATIAMLCKTSVARRLMSYCWKRKLEMGNCHIFPIDAHRNFGAAVEACLFVASFDGANTDQSCFVHEDFDLTSNGHRVGYRDGLLVSDVSTYEKWSFLLAETSYVWRSGVKHDCTKVMEFSEREEVFVNGFGEKVQLERDFLYPLLKSSDLAALKNVEKRWMLVTQRTVGEDTSTIKSLAPRTWQYLLDHAKWLDARASIVYRKRPRFCVFGVGEYSFAPWKVAISGFYKSLQFRVIGPCSGRPVMLDDTAYFLGCETEAEAQLLGHVLNSKPATEILSSLIFWDSKRPITIEVLSELSIEAVAKYLGKECSTEFHYSRTLSEGKHSTQCSLPW